MKRKRRLYIHKQIRPLKGGYTPDQIAAELKILMLQGKSREEIEDLLGYKKGGIGKLIRRLGLKNPYGVGAKKFKKPSLSYDDAIKKLKALNELGFPPSGHDVLHFGWQRKLY